jgi:hypothetical protein
MKIKLSKYEKEILNAYEKGELKTVKDFENKKKMNLAQFFQKSPFRGSNLKTRRNKTTSRTIK